MFMCLLWIFCNIVYCNSHLEHELGEVTSYKAGVYEHAAVTQPDPTITVSRKQALDIMYANLKIFTEQAVIASEQNVSMLVFPESGLYGVGHTRLSIYPYLEEVTDAGVAKNIPCTDILFPPIQRYLSCIARNHSIYIVANMGDIRPCDKATNPACPDDNRFQFSTNVVYDNEGKQVACYHKKHLFNESRFDPAPLAEHSTFKTHFGKFATLIYEDMFFNDTAVYLWWNYKINSIAVTSAGRNEFPFTLPVAAHRGFSTLFMYNVLAAGLSDSIKGYSGSGLFSENCGQYYVNLTSSTGKLLIGEVPVKVNKSRPCGPYNPGYHSSVIASQKNQLTTGKTRKRLQDSVPASVINFKGLIEGNSFTMAPLTKHNNVLQVCQGDVHCCELFYEVRSNPNEELYVLGAYMGNTSQGDPMFVRICILLKCRTNDLQTCGESVTSATTTFDMISLTSAADTIFMLPYVVTSTQNGSIDLGMEEFTYLPANFSSLKGFKNPLLSITLFETYYDPY